MANGAPTPRVAKQPEQVDVPILEIVQLAMVQPAVLSGPDGSRQLQLLQPNGKLTLVTFTAEQATALGHALAAPSVVVPSTGQNGRG